MILKALGSSAVTVPEIGLGTFNYKGGIAPLQKGFHEGAWLIDTADTYGSESLVGEAIRGLREKVLVATKVSHACFRYAEVLKAADRSLQQLKIDRIDLYQLHRPNYFVSIAETMSAMENLVDAGKVRFIGVSNFSVGQLKKAQQVLHKHRIVSNQVRYNLIDRSIEPALLPFCEANNITVIAYSPFAKRLQRLIDCDRRGTLKEIARIADRTVAQVAINWCLCKNRVIAIPKANSVERIVENCGASGWRLTSDQIQMLDQNIRFRRRTHLETMLRQYAPYIRHWFRNKLHLNRSITRSR